MTRASEFITIGAAVGIRIPFRAIATMNPPTHYSDWPTKSPPSSRATVEPSPNRSPALGPPNHCCCNADRGAGYLPVSAGGLMFGFELPTVSSLKPPESQSHFVFVDAAAPIWH